MKIYAGSDHAGVNLRGRLADHLRTRGHELVDLGPETTAPTDYPDYAGRVARAVQADPGSAGLLVCGSGIGLAITANKLRGIRAVDAWNLEAARLSRAHNDANVLCLGARLVDETLALAIADEWFATPFEGGRHARRVDKITGVERAEASAAAVQQEWALTQQQDLIRRLWRPDAAPDDHEGGREGGIAGLLAWHGSLEELPGHVRVLQTLLEQAKEDGFTEVLLLGSEDLVLCARMFAKLLPDGPPGLRVHPLASGDPATGPAVDNAMAAATFDHTLIVVVGSELETRQLAERIFAASLLRHGGDRAVAGRQFVLLTPHSPLAPRPRFASAARLALTELPGITERQLPLGLAGFLTALFLGLDLDALLAAVRRGALAAMDPTVAQNPAARLGGSLSALTKQGRGTTTVLVSPGLIGLGAWIERLRPQTTLATTLHNLTSLAAPGHGQLVVRISVDGQDPATTAEERDNLIGAGHTVVDIRLSDPHDVGGEFVRWWFAHGFAREAIRDLFAPRPA